MSVLLTSGALSNPGPINTVVKLHFKYIGLDMSKVQKQGRDEDIQEDYPIQNDGGKKDNSTTLYLLDMNRN